MGRTTTCPACQRTAGNYANGTCRSCYEKHLRQSNPEYAERQRKNRREWEARNGDRIKELAELRRTDPTARERDKKTKWGITLRKYGLTEDKYAELCSKGCAICGATKHLHIDHCHSTGKFRGILCSRCNNGLGFLDDCVEGLERALRYLKAAEHEGGA